VFRIGVDCRKINDGGIGVYLKGLLNSWRELNVPAHFYLFCNREDMGSLKYPSDIFELILHDYPKYSISELFSFSKPLARLKADIFFTPHYTLPFNLPCPAVVTIHDLIHLFYETRYGIVGKLYAKYMLRHACKRAEIVLTDSINSSTDINSFFPEWSNKVKVIYPAVDRNIFRRLSQDDIVEFKTAMKLPDDFALYTGALKPHKNPLALVRIANETNIPLVVATRDWKIFDHKLVPLLSDGSRIMKISITSDRQMALLYNAARMMIFPSFYEGFGLPPLEAMACGLPVVCSDSSSLPEVVGDAAMLFDPRNDTDIVDKINLCWRDEATRDILIARGENRAKLFCWRDSASRIFELFERILTR
jgi:glycosyltransferase involved in cell wall biosynthesis